MEKSAMDPSASEQQWRERLSAEEYRVLRQGGTEAPWSGEYVSTRTRGVYECRACGAPLFSSETKFEAHCGWPSFWSALAEDAVELVEDRSHGMRRTEVRCRGCGSHMGHVFDDAPEQPSGERYCINSVSVRLVAAE